MKTELGITQLSQSTIIAAAIEGYEAQKRQIDDQITQLRQMLIGGAASSPAQPAVKKRKFSDKAIQRMRAAQQLRWAKANGKGQPDTDDGDQQPKKKRVVTTAQLEAMRKNAKKARRAAKAAKLQRMAELIG